MKPETPRRDARRWQWWLWGAVGVYGAIVVVTVVARTWPAVGLEDYDEIRARTTSDFRDFWWTARYFSQSGELTADYGVHNYLPFFPLFMLPWSLLPLPVAAALFSVLSLALFGVAVALADNLLNVEARAGPRAAPIIAVALLLPYVHDCAVLGNVGLLLGFLLVATWFLVERGREWEAGAALGLAALIKLLPAVLIVLFLLRRRWRVAGAAALVCVVLGFGLPAAMLGPREALRQHALFFERAVQGHAAYATISADKPPKAYYKNSALPIVLRRLLTPLNASGSDAQAWRVNVADVPRPVVLVLYGLLVAVVLGATAFVAWQGGRRAWPPSDVADGRAVRAEYAAWGAAMILAAPLVWSHYLAALCWGLAWVADAGLRNWRITRRWPLGEAVVLLAWIVGIVGLAVPAARAAGVLLAPVALLWAVALRRAVWTGRGA